MAPLSRTNINSLLDNIQSIAQNVNALTDKINQMQEKQEELSNSLSTIIQTQDEMRLIIEQLAYAQDQELEDNLEDEVVQPTVNVIRDIDRPFRVMNGKRRALNLDVTTIEEMIQQKIFQGDHVASSNAIVSTDAKIHGLLPTLWHIDGDIFSSTANENENENNNNTDESTASSPDDVITSSTNSNDNQSRPSRRRRRFH
ncbi:hypothetical protein BDA99DRAFT_600620 [Phascolomyces articulosus]|uniref:Uncharacterized protein n=1 Tax=Phascolomyces articulosus TaxID=60185 RepID=A0AAD5KA90_9FUNG|nr:hypothetical protein BDA99DRAFT_600620 [Phascolomyces articulosus]